MSGDASARPGNRNPIVLISALAVVVLAAALWLVAPWPMPADAGEFQFVTRHLGLAHPPGYPLYTLVGFLFGRAVLALTVGHAITALGGPPADGWAWAQDLLALILALATLGIVFAAGRRLSGQAAGGWLSAALLAAAPTFVAQSTVAGVRMPTALLAALFLWQLLRGGLSTPLMAALTGLLFALAAGHHPSLVLLALPLIFIAVADRADNKASSLLGLVPGLALGLSPLAYLPLRDAAGALFATGDLTTPAGLLARLSGYDFRGDAFYFRDLATLVDRLSMLSNVMVLELGLGAALVVVGAVWMWRRQRARAVALIVFAAAAAASAILYRAPQTVEYLMPCYVALALLAAGTAPAMDALLAWRRALTTAAQGDPGAALEAGDNRSGAVHAPARAGARDRSITFTVHPSIVIVLLLALRVGWLLAQVAAANRAQAEHVWLPYVMKHPVPMLAGWHFATPLWVAASGRETDPRSIVSRIKYVAPNGAESYGLTWLNEARAARPGVLLLTNRPTDVVAAQLPLWPLPLQAGYLTLTAVPTATGQVDPRLPESMPSVQLPVHGDVLRSPFPPNAAVKLDGAEAARHEGYVTVRLRWTAQTAVSETVTCWAQLVDPATGAVWAQADQRVGEVAMPIRELEATRYSQFDLIPFRGSAPPTLRLIAGLYSSGMAGPERWRTPTAEWIDLGPVDLPAVAGLLGDALGLRSRAPAPGEVPFGSVMSLLATRVQVAPATPAGEQAGAGAGTVTSSADEIIVDLTWRADGPPDSDYTVSVQVVGDGWQAQDDGTPALGAIPTLKWLPGMVVHDRHRIALKRGDSPLTGFKVRVAVYDAFSLEPLPVTDAERVRRGEGQTAVVWP